MGVTLKAISKAYGAHKALSEISLDVGDGEFLTILGPSGSGKTTILRIVGGFTQPTAGRVWFGDDDITDVPTHKRPFNTVFQDYALFPHMTVEQNVGYGLKIKGIDRKTVRSKSTETLDIVGLGGFLDRYPAQLSGGQRQRVALARAIVCEPELILLDEPLAALDAEMRRQMQGFLKELQRNISTTFLFVTHDQEEAITMSDRIVVMDNGEIEQIGTPKEIYYSPKTPFVARFFGENNMIKSDFVDGQLRTPFGEIALPASINKSKRPVFAALRPEKLLFGAAKSTISIPSIVKEVIFIGSTTQLRACPLATPDMVLIVKMASDPNQVLPKKGDQIDLGFNAQDLAIIEVTQ